MPPGLGGLVASPAAVVAGSGAAFWSCQLVHLLGCFLFQTPPFCEAVSLQVCEGCTSFVFHLIFPKSVRRLQVVCHTEDV